MVNYQLGKIYKIVSNTDPDKCYIGSTTKQYLSQRFAQHKAMYKFFLNGKCTKTTSFDLFDEFGIDNCMIVLLETYSCNSKDELHSRERYFIETLNCVNKIVVGRTQNEYITDNKEIIKVKRKEFYEKNKESLLGIAKEYRMENKDKISEKMKEYCEKNKETLNQKKKEYYEQNKTAYNEKRKEKFTCDCGSTIRKSDHLAHNKSAKHQKYLLTI
jgi:hypothetical protein